ncbi:MAG: NAD(P)-dependent oxidoreductase [Clostridia bacterium]|nr:NAD(P)-dependent oxidoreductase [Clostridia bacterium]
MKILIIGGTGHVGTFLVKKLVNNGHQVFVGTRGKTRQREGDYFNSAQFIECNANDSESLNSLKQYRFDAVVDFPGTAFKVWTALKNDVSHVIACGSLWMFGYPHVVPTPEIRQDDVPFSSYRDRYAEMQTMLSESGIYKAVFTGIMPPNICGPGKIPIDQYGGRSIDMHRAMSEGKTVYIPDGPECLINPCDAEDIATLFKLAIENRTKSAGQLFNVGADYSLTVSQMINAYADIYGVKIPTEKVSWEKYIGEINTDKGGWWHFYAHMYPDLSKAKTILNYSPKYTPEESLRRAVEWMKQQNLL